MTKPFDEAMSDAARAIITPVYQGEHAGVATWGFLKGAKAARNFYMQTVDGLSMAESVAASVGFKRGVARMESKLARVRELEQLVELQGAYMRKLEQLLEAAESRLEEIATASEWITEPRLRNWKDVCQRLAGEAAMALAEIRGAHKPAASFIANASGKELRNEENT